MGCEAPAVPVVKGPTILSRVKDWGLLVLLVSRAVPRNRNSPCGIGTIQDEFLLGRTVHMHETALVVLPRKSVRACFCKAAHDGALGYSHRLHPVAIVEALRQ